MLISLANWILNFTAGLNYFGIGLLMAIESSFIPLPSEIVMPPAGYLASLGHLNVFLVILAGVVGSVLGSTINYLLSWWLGRPIVYRLAGTKAARFLLITPEKIATVEESFLKNASAATFFSRLIPVARHLISIPAGFTKMPFGSFIFYTAAGSAIWVSILTALGYFLGSNQALLLKYYRELSWTLLGLGLIWLLWLIFWGRKNKRN